MVTIINTPKHNANNSAAIGIFDSGVGGLSIAKYITEHLPNENIIYVADSLHAPYGEKSVDFITQRVNTIADKLITQGVKAIVIACNTATVNAIEQLRSRVNIPIIGVEPAVKPAAKLSISKKVAVLATQATSDNKRFKALIEQHHNGAEVFIQPCPGLVEFIEQGDLNSAACYQLINDFVTPLVNKGIDTLVLGCTHYPFVQHHIRAIAGQEVIIIETAAPVTMQLQKKLQQAKLLATDNEQVSHQFFSTSVNQQQLKTFSDLWQQPVTLAVLQ